MIGAAPCHAVHIRPIPQSPLHRARIDPRTGYARHRSHHLAEPDAEGRAEALAAESAASAEGGGDAVSPDGDAAGLVADAGPAAEGEADAAPAAVDEAVAARTAGNAEDAAAAVEFIRAVDVDGDGMASKEEIVASGFADSEAEADAMIAAVDTDGDGKLSKEEVLEALTQPDPAPERDDVAAPPPQAEPELATVDELPQTAPAPPTADPRRKIPSNPLDMTWAVGCDCVAPGSCHYLGDGDREEIFYANGNTGVLFAHVDNEQALLQGHRNTIAKTCVSADKRWLATADTGEDSALIVWDSISGVPVRTWFSDIVPSVAAMSFSQDGALLAVVSGKGTPKVSLWDWSAAEMEEPVAEIKLDHFKTQPTDVSFYNQGQSTLVVTSPDQVDVMQVDFVDGSTQAMQLSVGNIDRSVQWGDYCQSMFVPDYPTVATTTTGGYLLIWDIEEFVSGATVLCKKFIQLFDVACTFAAFTPDGKALVAGGQDGKIRYFDTTFRLIGWLDDLDLGPVASISFAVPDKMPNRRTSMFSVGLDHAEFEVPNYIVSTQDGRILKVTNNHGEQLSEEIINGHNADLRTLAAHPSEPLLALSGESRKLQIWNYTYKTDVISTELPEGQYPTAMAFSPTGETLVVGFSDGSLQLLDAMSLTLLSESMLFARFDGEITKIVFAHDGTHFAISSSDFFVGVFRLKPEDYNDPWEYVGKHRSHSSRVTDVQFGTEADGVTIRLLSVGEDRMMVEYDLIRSSFAEGLLLGAPSGASRMEVEQTAYPEAFAWYPDAQGEQFFIMANSEFKFKLLNATTKMCRKTVLASTLCGAPLTRMAVIPAYPNEDSQRVLAYTTGEKVGLTLIGVDGNPNSSMAVVGHPGNINSMVCSYDGRYLFTAGGRSVNMWAINTHLLVATSRLAGEGILPYINMIEGGKEGQLFKDMEDYFYYAQVEHQGINSMEERSVSDHLLLSEVPRVLRALGYYPSDREIMNITNEVKFSKMMETKQMVDTVTLDDLIKIYVNHRPAISLTSDAIDEAFKALGKDGEVGTGELVALLKDVGEQMTEEEFIANLGKLLGSDTLSQVLGPVTNAGQFAGEILGF